MQEIIFWVEESDEGGYIAKGMGNSIFIEANILEELRSAVKDAVHCHFDDSNPRLIRLRFMKEEVFSA